MSLPAPAIVLRHEANRGKGAAIKTAMRYALEANERDDRKILRVRAKYTIRVSLPNQGRDLRSA